MGTAVWDAAPNAAQHGKSRDVWCGDFIALYLDNDEGYEGVWEPNKQCTIRRISSNRSSTKVSRAE